MHLYEEQLFSHSIDLFNCMIAPTSLATVGSERCITGSETADVNSKLGQSQAMKHRIFGTHMRRMKYATVCEIREDIACKCHLPP